MNEQEKYLFDLQGFMTVPHALSGEQVAALNRIWDQKIAQDMETGATTQRWVGLLDWGQPFRELIDNP
ncbi:MAG: hypothetical protein KDE46_22650, partial [Caldilineaceae bacterium]|nr:hypothetical protein [Caldilineaceae bacterium]